MQPAHKFYAAWFFEHSPISSVRLCAQIPSYTCPACGRSGTAGLYSYPNLDVCDVVSKEERKRLGPAIRVAGSDAEIIQIVERMRQKWKVPVAAGTIVGPTRVKVTSKPKVDFDVLVCHAALFCRRPAAEKLTSAGLRIEFVETPATGKYGLEANYVEFVVPVLGHNQLPLERSFCGACFRYNPGGSFPAVLLPDELPLDQPFFKTLETGTMIFSGKFLELVSRLGITGLEEGETVHPVRVAENSSPRPTQAELEAEWRDYRDRVRELKRSMKQVRP